MQILDNAMDKAPFLDAAPALWAAGLPVIPLIGKRAFLIAWTRYCLEMPTEADRADWLASHPNNNIGLPLGPSSGLCVVDIDSTDPAVIASVKACLPASPWDRVGKKGCALIYSNSRNLKSFSIPGLIDFLAEGRQIVLPPSIHPDTGSPYVSNADLAEVYKNGDIPEIPTDLKERLLGATAPAAEAGGRHVTLASNIGCLRNAGLYARLCGAFHCRSNAGNSLQRDICKYSDRICRQGRKCR